MAFASKKFSKAVNHRLMMQTFGKKSHLPDFGLIAIGFSGVGLKSARFGSWTTLQSMAEDTGTLILPCTTGMSCCLDHPFLVPSSSSGAWPVPLMTTLLSAGVPNKNPNPRCS